jgi:hypothetical protein
MALLWLVGVSPPSIAAGVPLICVAALSGDANPVDRERLREGRRIGCAATAPADRRVYHEVHGHVGNVRKPAPSSGSTDQINAPAVHSTRYTMNRLVASNGNGCSWSPPGTS